MTPDPLLGAVVALVLGAMATAVTIVYLVSLTQPVEARVAERKEEE